MGDFNVRKIRNTGDRTRMYEYALRDIRVFQKMINEGLFSTKAPKIGAEQEICIVDNNYNPTTSALELLEDINDERYTNELALFNLEINLDPLPLSGTCFSENEKILLELLSKGKSSASKLNQQLLLAGILPTLKYRHLQFEYMTPIERYQTLSKTLSEIRGSKFQIYVQGVDEIIMSLGSVLFEACNTSFQLHLQIHPDNFVAKHNWSQMIAGPVLSACVNSPLLFGNELWAESRIALFKQSLDTRSSSKFMRKKLSRVYFGEEWLHESAAELWKNDIMRFPLIVTSDDLENSEEKLNRGEVPNLKGIRLHNGTTYTWNRICYGPTDPPHLRIECRYIPSGPSVRDEIANFALWIGLMNSTPKQGDEFWKKIGFKNAKNNFVKAARYGLDSVFDWFGKKIPAKQLLLDELIPLAETGLRKHGVDDKDIKLYLGTIEKRVQKEITGSRWIVDNFRKVNKNHGSDIAEKTLVKEMLKNQQANIPVHDWDNIDPIKSSFIPNISTVEQHMTRDIISVQEDCSLELIRNIFQWNDIHHLPIENMSGDLVGLITDGMMTRLHGEEHSHAMEIMLENPTSLQTTDTISFAKYKMSKTGVSGFPVVYKGKLVGMLTANDLNKTASGIKKSPASN